MNSVIRDEESAHYLESGKDFIDDDKIESLIAEHRCPDTRQVRDILDQSLALQRLDPHQAAMLVNVSDEDLWQEMFNTAAEVKNRVYGPRIVTFAPLYCSNICVNSCLYCGFRRENKDQKRRILSIEEIREETRALVALGHKRLIMVYGEHPLSDTGYIADTIRAVYETKVDRGEIRRVNINAAPQSVARFKLLKEVGIGTYQVFQETYHHKTYAKVHPRGIKSDYRWRLYALHRAQAAGVDDVAIGALFGLYDWKFEVLGLLHHAMDLEAKFGGVGPHTISFPRLEPAQNAPLTNRSPYRVSDRDFKRLVTVIRLCVPYTGMIVTAREPAHIRREAMGVGCTQTDASTKIGIGAYSEARPFQQADNQQFNISDNRSLDEMVQELTRMGYLTSFCTAGYRCGRTGQYFMALAKQGHVNHFCIPNAILTLKEYLLDYAAPQTRALGEALIERRLLDFAVDQQEKIKSKLGEIENGGRDLFF
jgi:2-iminoacetate synthase